MPNHVQNEISFYCTEDEVKEIKAFMTTEESDFDFNKLIPMPSNDDFIRDGMLSMDAKEKSSGRNWYDWSIENWGTKWNAYEVEWDCESVRFWTAWSQVPKIVMALSDKFPNITMDYRWANEDIGYGVGECQAFCGMLIAKNQPLGGTKEAYELAFDIWGTSPSECYLRYDENKGTYVYDESR